MEFYNADNTPTMNRGSSSHHTYKRMAAIATYLNETIKNHPSTITLNRNAAS